MTDTQLGSLLVYASHIGIILGVLTFVAVIHQVYQNKQFNSWLATHLFTILRTIIVLMAIPIAGAFFELPAAAQVALIGMLAYLAPVMLLVTFLWSDGVPVMRRKLDAKAVIAELEATYPGKNIFCVPENNPTVIICELERTAEYSKIIAVTEISDKHYHEKITESFRVLRGRLEVWTICNDKKYREVLAPGLSTSVGPKVVHWTVGVDEYEDTWVEAVCVPPWTKEDQHPA